MFLVTFASSSKFVVCDAFFLIKLSSPLVFVACRLHCFVGLGGTTSNLASVALSFSLGVSREGQAYRC